MTMTARRSISADEITAVAADVFAHYGYAGTTLDRVASRFGITRQGVLHYFGSKQELFRAVLQRDKEWAAQKSASAPDRQTIAPLLALSVFVDTSDESMQRLRLLHVLRGEAIAGDEDAARFIHERTTGVQQNVRSTVERSALHDGLRAGWTVDTATDAVMAMIDGLQTAALVRTDVDPTAVFTLFIESIAALPPKGTPNEN